MPFFLPWLAVGAAVALGGWGIQQLVTKDDSADEIAGKFIATLPERLGSFVDSVEVTEKGTSVHFKKGTPESVKTEIEDRIKQLDS